MKTIYNKRRMPEEGQWVKQSKRHESNKKKDNAYPNKTVQINNNSINQ